MNIVSNLNYKFNKPNFSQTKPQIARYQTNPLSQDTVSFSGKAGAKKNVLIQGLCKNMNECKIEEAKDLYQSGIDYLGNKIDKKDFLKRTFVNVENLYPKPSISKIERYFVDDFYIAFDMFGSETFEKVSDEDIRKMLKLLSSPSL